MLHKHKQTVLFREKDFWWCVRVCRGWCIGRFK